MILITGASGFLGRHVFALGLRQGLKLCPLVRNEAKYRQLFPKGPQPLVRDLRNLEGPIVLDQPIEGLIHLASEVWPVERKESSEFAQANVQGTANLLRVLENSALKQMVVASTFSIYGKLEGKISESSPVQPAVGYAVSKWEEEALCQKFAAQKKIPCAVLRFSSIYGSGQYEKTVLPIFWNLARENQNIEITGPQGRLQNFLYVQDAAEVTLRSFERKADGIFGIGGAKETSMAELAQEVVHVLESRSQIVMRESADKSPSFHYEIEKAQRELNWQPRYSLAQALEEMKEKNSV